MTVQGLAAMMAVDAAGLMLGWRVLGHAAHLGGAIFGLAYCYYGKVWTVHSMNHDLAFMSWIANVHHYPA